MSDPWASLEGLSAAQRARLDEVRARSPEERWESQRQSEVEQAKGRKNHNLTPRELDVLQLIAHGKSNAEIATELFIEPATVKSHVATMLPKLGAATRAHAVWLGRGLLE